MRENRPRNGHNNGAQNNEPLRKIGTHQTKNQNGNNQDCMSNDNDSHSAFYYYQNLLKENENEKANFNLFKTFQKI